MMLSPVGRPIGTTGESDAVRWFEMTPTVVSLRKGVQVSLRLGNCELILFAPWAVINHNPHTSLEPGVPNPSLDLLAASVDDLDAEPGALPGVADRFAVPGLGLWVLKQKCSYCGGEVDERAFEAEDGVGEVGEEGRLGRHAERRAVLKVQKLLSTR